MKYKTLFFSDIHLGSVGSQPEKFLNFIKDNEFEKIFIIGDFIDFWALKRKPDWPQSHNDVIQKLLRKHRKGTEIIYVTGNHDEFMEQFDGEAFGGIKIYKESEHTLINNNKILIIHGHQLDTVTKYAPWLSHVGSFFYDKLIMLNYRFNKIRKYLGLNTHWSLSQFVKTKVKEAVNFIGNFEKGLSHLAKNKGYNMVMAGHIHCPTIKTIDDVVYINTGDWVETISCVIEDYDSKLYLLKEINGEMKTISQY